MRASSVTGYAVIWQRTSGPTYAGRLEIGDGRIRMAGSAPEEHRTQLEQIPLELVESVSVARGSDARLKDLPTLVLDVRGTTPLRVATVAGPGALSELARRIAQRLRPGAGR